MDIMEPAAQPQDMQKQVRFLTGSREGRVIEILQTARRAGATKVAITNTNGRITVRDNGRGIGDFSELLNRVGSVGRENPEEYDYPPGLGLVCLAPRELIVRCRGLRGRIGPASCGLPR